MFQWVVVTGWMVSFVVLTTFHLNHALEGRHSPWGCAMGFIHALAHGLWITLDARILNRKVGGWRFAAFFFGPFTLWVWFVVAYGRKAVFLIPISLAVYAAAVAQIYAVGMLGAVSRS